MRSHPYLDPYSAMVGPIARSLPLAHAELDRAFAEARAARFPDEPELRFVVQATSGRRRRRDRTIVDPADSYDGRITNHREVPTRTDDAHDACNFLVWLAFPRTKRALHARQLAARERWIAPGSVRIPGARTREQDAITLFDEGGVVWLDTASDERGTAATGAPAVIAFGHALLEHFGRSDQPIAATAMRVTVANPRDPDAIDRAIEARILDEASFREPGLDALVRLDANGVVEFVTRP